MNLQRYWTPLTAIDGETWMLACATSVISFIAIHGCIKLFRRHLCKLRDQAQAERPAVQLLEAMLERTSTLAILLFSVLLGLTVLEPPAPWDQRLRHLWFIVLGLQLVLYLDRGVSLGAQRYFRHRGDRADSAGTVASTLVVWLLQTAIWIIFILAVLSNLGINVSTLVASLGIGGVAVALAVQNVLGDLFASLSIAVDKPFEVGDAIAFTGVSGTVEHVGLKTTRIRSDSGEQVVIGNAQLLKNTMRNFKRMETRRVQFSINVNPSTPAELAAKVPDMLKDIVSKQEGVRPDRVHLKSVRQDAIEFELVFHILNPSYASYMDAQQAILLSAMAGLAELGVAASAAPYRLVVDNDGAPQADDESLRPPKPRALQAGRQ